MLAHPDHSEAAEAVVAAIERVLSSEDKIRSIPDIGGTGRTTALSTAIAAAL
ncbi:hypothetical protein [Erwinia sp. 198]|uniref:hypothetical protein n=1 Tax=Erwinia sp. 198 TaxID=2022746 RepID=UPI001F2FCF84|nr:hypothetical protein [Erwinia sp. 198]